MIAQSHFWTSTIEKTSRMQDVSLEDKL
jgi:hypothetical protein